MAKERRLQLLESAVLGMSDKFDAVMSSLSPRADTQQVVDVEPAAMHDRPRPPTTRVPVNDYIP